MKRIYHKLYMIFWGILTCILLTGCSADEYVEDIDTGDSSILDVNTGNEESSESEKSSENEESSDNEEPSENAEDISEEAAQGTYFNFLSGDVSLLEDVELGQSWVDFYLPNSELEYVFLDLDGDDVSELLIQGIDSPESLNAVFHYSAGTLFCWDFDSVEMSSRDYPLQNGTMVHQYDYSGTSSWTGFRYLPDGEKEELFELFARYEVIADNDTSPVPYYEIDGAEVDQKTFESELEKRITNQKLDRSSWIVNGTTDDEAVLQLKPCAAYQDILDNAYEVIIADTGPAGWNNRILLMYTLHDDKPVLLIEGWARIRYYLLNDGTIYNEGSSGAAYTSFGIYRISEDGSRMEDVPGNMM